MPSYHISRITLSTFNDFLARYPSIATEKLRELDTLRYDTIPATVATREGNTFLEKDEVENLVEWKLKHGTFRPKLLQLVQSNDEKTIQDTTSTAFKDFETPIPAVKTLSVLKGIGPATASLLLSVAAPDSVPFFSDELFRWCIWDEPGSPDGWQRKIKYNIKEYEVLVNKVGALVKRLKVRAVDVEKVAWVLGKEEANIDMDGDDNGEQEVKKGGDASKDIAKDKPKKQIPKGTKRKAAETKVATEGTRKSTRTRK